MRATNHVHFVYVWHINVPGRSDRSGWAWFYKNKPDPKGGFDFWQPQIDNIRTEISLYEAEIMETLDLLEEFLNDLKH